MRFSAKKLAQVSYKVPCEKPAEMIVVSHGLVAARKLEKWNQNGRNLFKDLHFLEGLVFCRTFYNYYNPAEFVGLMGWNSHENYQKCRMIGDMTVEEHLYTGLRNGSSMLAAYNQFQCKPLKLR